MKHYPNSVSKALALLMALVMTLSLAVTSAFAVSYQDMNPKDDALLGTKFPVDATITLVTDENGKDVSLSIPVSGMTKDALAAAVSAVPSRSHSSATILAPTSTRSCSPTLTRAGILTAG